jgi:glutamate 5-kinase
VTVDRSVFRSAGRVVVKVGSSSLARPKGGLDEAKIMAVSSVVASATQAGRQVVLVSSGAIAGAMGPLRMKSRPRDLATQQAAASVGQGALMRLYAQAFDERGLVVGQVLLSADDVIRRTHYRNAQRTLYRLMDLGVVPIVNENDTVATDELRFGDNDRLAALVAHLVHAEALVLLSDVPGLYDGKPGTSDARIVSDVRDPAEIADVRFTGRGRMGSGGMQTKVAAARIAAGAGIPVLLASAADAADALSGAAVGTMFHPTGKRIPTRLLWLAHAADPVGGLHLDAGAVAAVVGSRKSLLPAGISRVSGDFTAGDPVDLFDESGHVVARGLVNFDSVELPVLLGRSTRELERELGSAYRREVVHRDDLVVLRATQ